MLKQFKMTGVALIATLAIANYAVANSHHKQKSMQNTVPVKALVQVATFIDSVANQGTDTVAFSTKSYGNTAVLYFPSSLSAGTSDKYQIQLPYAPGGTSDQIISTVTSNGGKTVCRYTFTSAGSGQLNVQSSNTNNCQTTTSGGLIIGAH